MRNSRPNPAPRSPSRVVATLLILAMAYTAGAQQAAPLPPRAAAIKKKADTLATDAKISVIPLHGPEEYGTFVSNDQEGLTFFDVDSNTQITLKYVEVKKLKEGYGGYNSLRQRHTDRTHAAIAAAAIGAGLAALLIAVAVEKN